MICRICPRRCGVERPLRQGGTGVLGYCGQPLTARVARAGLHFWEEPPVSGTRGAGTVFFSGCNLRCVYCQNYDLSRGLAGWEADAAALRRIYRRLEEAGAHNIDLVTPTHFAGAVLESLEEPPGVPVIYNSGGYESVETLKLFEGKVQIYLPDFKYASSRRAALYSGAADYPEVALAAIREMIRQTGPYVIDGEGLLRRGVLIRHMMLPGGLEDSLAVVRLVAENFRPGEVLFSLLRQYLPCGRVLNGEFPELNRRVGERAYGRVVAEMFDLGMTDGFTQGRGAAAEEFIPVFDGTGLDIVR